MSNEGEGVAMKKWSLVAIILFAVGCASPTATPTKPTARATVVRPTAVPTKASPAQVDAGRCVTALSGNKFCDEGTEGYDLAGAYETARDTCSVFTVRQVAKEYNTEPDAVSAAEGFAAGYRVIARQAAFEGCLDGFSDQE